MGGKTRHISLFRLFHSIVGQGQPVASALEHIGTCNECQGNRDLLKEVVRFGAGESLTEPPKWAVVNSVSAFRLKKPSAVRFARELIAELIYDSFSQPLPVGMRQRDLPARQTLYRADGLELDLKVQLTGEEKGVIVGQVLCEEKNFALDDLEIALSNGGEQIGSSSTNSWGEFMFSDLPRGDYEIQVHFGEKVLRLPKVPIGNSLKN